MSLIPKVKCGRCDRSYSGLKLKCPYCGAGRSRSGKRSFDAGDGGARRMIKVFLLLVLVITVISMIVLDLEPDPVEGNRPGVGPGMTQNGSGSGNETNGPEATPTPPPPTPPPPTPTPVAVTSLSITWAADLGFGEMTLSVGDRLELWCTIFPTDATADIRWTTERPQVANFTQNAEDHRRIDLEARSSGESIITVTAGDMSAEVLVRVR